MIGESITQLSALELRHGACSDGPEWADDYYSTSIYFGPQAQHPFTRLGFLIARRAPRRVAAAAAVEKAHDATSLHRQIKVVVHCRQANCLRRSLWQFDCNMASAKGRAVWPVVSKQVPGKNQKQVQEIIKAGEFSPCIGASANRQPRCDCHPTAERTALSRARGEGLESLPDARRLRHQSHLQWLLIQYVAWSGGKRRGTASSNHVLLSRLCPAA